MKKILLLVLATGALMAGIEDDIGFSQIDNTIASATTTAKGVFKFIVMIVSWGLVLSAVFFTNKYKEKQLDRLDNKQGEEGSYFMLYVKVAMTATISLVVVGFIIYMLWGKILPIAGDNTQDYGVVIINALTGVVNSFK